MYLSDFSHSGEVIVSRPVSAIGNLRPISMYARMAASNGDPRYMVGAIFAQQFNGIATELSFKMCKYYELTIVLFCLGPEYLEGGVGHA